VLVQSQLLVADQRPKLEKKVAEVTRDLPRTQREDATVHSRDRGASNSMWEKAVKRHPRRFLLEENPRGFPRCEPCREWYRGQLNLRTSVSSYSSEWAAVVPGAGQEVLVGQGQRPNGKRGQHDEARL